MLVALRSNRAPTSARPPSAAHHTLHTTLAGRSEQPHLRQYLTASTASTTTSSLVFLSL